MPFGSEGAEESIGLALSGGGFRASLFHVGTILRLREVGLLQRLGRISCVSGGAITGAILAKAWPQLEAEAFSADAVSRHFVDPVRQFCRRGIDAAAIGQGILLPWKRASDILVENYRDGLLADLTLQGMTDNPKFIFNSTNLQTGRSFRFSKSYIGDYRIGLIRGARVSLATAVAASSAFPPFLSPLVIDAPGAFEATEGADLNDRPEFTRQLMLTDGGAYDNLGLETVWNRCRTILVSDAGAPFAIEGEVNTDWVRQTLRALDIATDQARALRKRALISDFQAGLRAGAYWGIDTAIADYPLPDPLPCDDALVAPLARLRTRLDPFDETEQGRLINWGYALCDAALRSRAPVLAPGASRPASWPCPGQALGSI